MAIVFSATQRCIAIEKEVFSRTYIIVWFGRLRESRADHYIYLRVFYVRSPLASAGLYNLNLLPHERGVRAKLSTVSMSSAYWVFAEGSSKTHMQSEEEPGSDHYRVV